MGSLCRGASDEGGNGFGDRQAYEPPSLVVLGTVQELTGAGLTGQPDGLGAEELGGS